MKQWCDIEDQDGFWKVGYIVQRQSFSNENVLKVRMDGYHPGYDTFFCNHSKKLFPVRTYTMGLNSHPKKTSQMVFRQPLNLDQLKLNYNRLTLIGRMQNLLQNTEQNVRIFMRTELLILIDKIIRTPFALISSIKMCELEINKLFIGIINFYIKLLDSSKKFLPLLDSDHKMANELLLAMQEFSIMTKLIIGSHKSSKQFFEDQLNLTIKTDGFIECFIMSDHGILPFKIFFKNLSTISLKKLNQKSIDSIFQVLDLLLDLCERSKGELFENNFLPQTKSVVDEVINFLKVFATFDETNLKYLKLKVETINRLETLQIKLKPNKTSLLRNQIFGQQKENKQKKTIKLVEKEESQKSASVQEIDQLKKRVKKLEDLLNNFTTTEQNFVEQKNQTNLLKSVKNLGEEQFLASLSWALNCGDLQVCRKLVIWRQNLLRLGRIAGWEIALQVGLKTMGKAEITHQDIIGANIQMLKQASSKQKSQQKFLGPLGKASNKTPSNQTNKAEKD